MPIEQIKEDDLGMKKLVALVLSAMMLLSKGLGDF